MSNLLQHVKLTARFKGFHNNNLVRRSFPSCNSNKIIRLQLEDFLKTLPRGSRFCFNIFMSPHSSLNGLWEIEFQALCARVWKKIGATIRQNIYYSKTSAPEQMLTSQENVQTQFQADGAEKQVKYRGTASSARAATFQRVKRA